MHLQAGQPGEMISATGGRFLCKSLWRNNRTPARRRLRQREGGGSRAAPLEIRGPLPLHESKQTLAEWPVSPEPCGSPVRGEG